MKNKIFSWIKKALMPSGSDAFINLAVLVLIVFGTVMIVSTSLGTSIGKVSGVFREGAKQAVIALASLVLYILAARMFSWKTYRYFRFLLVGLFLSLMVLTFLIGTEHGGSRAWIIIGGVSFQPSELAKPLLIASCGYAAYRHAKGRRKTDSFWEVFKEPLLLLLVALGLTFLQKDIGTMVIILGITLTCFMIPGWNGLKKVQHWIKITLAIVLIGGVLSVYVTNAASTLFRNVGFLSHMATRIDNMKNPYLDVYGEGYQPANALYGIADAGIFGKGIGNSARKYGYLTQADSDYIIAVVIEETGLIGLGLIVLMYGVIVRQLFYYALKTKNTGDKVVYGGTAAYILLHFIINVGGVTTLIPMTGVPLLFISGGGSSLISICLAMGVAQSRIAAYNREAKKL